MGDPRHGPRAGRSCVDLYLQVLRSAKGAALVFAVWCAGASPSAWAAAEICISPNPITFGNRSTGSAATVQSTVSNCGDAAWSFSNVSIDPATGSGFQISTSCHAGATLQPGASCVVDVRFAPLSPGQTSGGVHLDSSAVTPNRLLTFYGRGVDSSSGGATLEFTPAVAVFSSQQVGTQSPPLDVQFSNKGPGPLQLTAIVVNGPDAYDFTGVSGSCTVGATIAAGDACHATLYFHPQTAGQKEANLVVDSPQLAALAIMQVIGTASNAPTSVAVVEFYNASQDHYFISSRQADIDALDSGYFSGWTRTGKTFLAYPVPTMAAMPVCRFYIPPAFGDSHFFSASPDECSAVALRFPAFVEESPNIMYVDLPDPSSGACPAGDLPVYRMWNARVDTNHRYTTDVATRALMLTQGWIAEGYGPNAVAMCTPQY